MACNHFAKNGFSVKTFTPERGVGFLLFGVIQPSNSFSSSVLQEAYVEPELSCLPLRTGEFGPNLQGMQCPPAEFSQKELEITFARIEETIQVGLRPHI